MKKLFLSASIVLSAIFVVKSQTTVLFQNFQSSGTSLPVGWSQELSSTNGGWEVNNHYGSLMGANVASHTYCAFIDDWDSNYNVDNINYDTLYTPIMNCSAYAHVFLSLDYMFWRDNGAETATEAVSINGGATWETLTSFLNTRGAWSDTAVIDISPYLAGQSDVRLAFTYYDGYGSPNNGYTALGMGLDNIDVFAPLNYDLSVKTQNTQPLMQVGNSYTFSGTIYNYGGDTIQSMNMNYIVSGDPSIHTQTISGINGFSGLSSYNWSMNNTPFTPSTTGVYTIKYWADNINGAFTDQNHSNDTLVATFWALSELQQRSALYEEFTGQSCVFCLTADPNVDSVANNNATTANIIRYHVPIPGRDFMYNESSGVVQSRETYYSVISAPKGLLDGTNLNPSANGQPDSTERYSTTTVQADNSLGSPFAIDITSANYDAAKDSFHLSANITAYTAFAAGLNVQVALTIDSITYFQDLSTDDPQQEFAPPIGSGASGYSYADAPDYYFPYLLKFTHVLEDMLPNGNGTTLAAFTSGQTQTISVGWKKNHPWGQYPKATNATLGDSTLYDSSSTAHFVVFVQTNNILPAEGIPAKYVFQSASVQISGITGIQELSQDIYFEMYPNPTNGNTNITFKLNKDQNVIIEVYNMVGENVYSLNENSMQVGMHTIIINGSGLCNGVYFVRFSTGNSTTTRKLIIDR